MWAILRLFHVSSVRSTFVDPSPGMPDLSVAEELLLLTITGLAVHLDARRRREDLFLGNLGITRAAIVAVSLIIPGVLELLLP